MPEPTPVTLVPEPSLAEVVAAEVLLTPGVVRLEPTLRNALHRFAPGSGSRRSRYQPAGSTDGVTITRVGAAVDVTADIAVATTTSALDCATWVRERIVAVLAARGLEVGSVNVNVLAVVRASAEPAG